jgi:hypothetical protein
MRLPNQAPAVSRSVAVSRSTSAVEPSGCNIFKAASCVAATVACGAVCYASLGTACVQCLAAIGASGCIDCF